MSGALSRLPAGSRIALIRLRSLGDCVLTTPAIALLHRARPDLQIALVVEDRFRAVFTGNPAVSEILPPKILPLRRYRPALAVNLHGGPRSARLLALSGAPLRAGFAHHPYRRLFNIAIPTAQEILGVGRKVHTAEHLAAAIFFLGADKAEIPAAQLFLDASARSPWNAGHPYAVIHPMASEPEKAWPQESFLHTALSLKQDFDLEPVFLAGPGEDLSAFGMWPTITSGDLEQTKSLIAGASLFLGNDSGPAHMAGAFQIPSAVLFGPSDPVVWAPWRTPSEVLVSDGPIDRIPVERVLDSLEKLRVAA